ncbi:DnaJ domain-containing protein [Inconstantimicrobium porci]|nr:DnaJ domain-containing protein [Inconstantimicrobium porci]MDD6772236.1 hypothetical protein [Inconstantimicrobium porci]
MDCFDILGISSNSDKKAIKHAYAKLLKKYNPEDDPEGYQKLREAYDNALKYEKSNKISENSAADSYENDDNSQNPDDDKSYDNIIIQNTNNNTDIFNTSFDIHNNVEDYLNDTYDEKAEKDNCIDSYHTNFNTTDLYEVDNYYDYTNDIAIFINKLNGLYSNLKLRTNKEEWKQLLNNDLLWNLETVVKVKGIIISFICKHRFITKDVMNQIDDILKINGNEISNSYTYNQKDIDTYIDIYYHADTMSYKYMYDINPIDQDKYIKLRLRMNNLLNSNKHNFVLSEIKNYFNTAVNLYDKDPEIYMMMADYYLEIGYIDNALEMYKKVLNIDCYYASANKNTGEILFYRNDFIHSLEYLEVYIKSTSDDIRALYMIAHCYYYTKQYSNSLEYFNIICSRSGRNKYINKYIKNINRKINGMFSSTIKFNRIQFDNLGAFKSFDNINKKTTTKNHKTFIISIIILIFVLSISRISLYKSNRNTMNNSYSKTYTKDGYKAVNTLNDFKSSPTNTRISITLSDVEVMDCYKLVTYSSNTPTSKVTTFMQKQDMINQDYWTHAHGRIYSGKINGQRIFFECSKNLNMIFDKNKRYIIKGYISTVNSEMFKSLSTFVEKPDNYVSTKYISTSPLFNLPANQNTDLSKYKKEMDKLTKELNEKYKDHRN